MNEIMKTLSTHVDKVDELGGDISKHKMNGCLSPFEYDILRVLVAIAREINLLNFIIENKAIDPEIIKKEILK